MIPAITATDMDQDQDQDRRCKARQLLKTETITFQGLTLYRRVEIGHSSTIVYVYDRGKGTRRLYLTRNRNTH